MSRILVPARGMCAVHGKGGISGRGISCPNCMLIRTTFMNRVPVVVHGAPGILNFLNSAGRSDHGVGTAPLHPRRITHVLNHISRVGTVRRRGRVPFFINRAIGIASNPFSDFRNAVRTISGRHGGLAMSIGVFKHGAPVRLNFARMRGRWLAGRGCNGENYYVCWVTSRE